MKPFPISRPLAVADVAERGTRVAFEASVEERAALADFLGVPAVRAFSVDVEATPWRAAGVRLSGRVSGAVEQACVVTLEPVVQAIEEAIDLRLLPEDGRREGTRDAPTAREVVVDPLGEDPPETFRGGKVDVGAVATEHFALGIDPYPRAPGAVFEGSGGDDPEAAGAGEESPFAALSRLKGG